MLGIIYKITNIVNNKVYIGQTQKTLEERFKHHVNFAKKDYRSKDICFARAIRKYGENNFIIEKIDEADSKELLNEKEKYWINFYDSFKSGYNSTLGGDGGNTYRGRSEKLMQKTKAKLSRANLGIKNGNHRSIKCKSVLTGREIVFDTVTECLKYFGYRGKAFCIKRAQNKDKTLFKNEWIFAYKENNYNYNGEIND
jgi:group I intron endonuclease